MGKIYCDTGVRQQRIKVLALLYEYAYTCYYVRAVGSTCTGAVAF